MTAKRWFYPVVIWLMGLAIALVYIFRFPNYYLLNDLEREYFIYLTLITSGSGSLSFFWGTGSFSLQSSCLSVTLFPALLQKVTGIEPLLFYKLYCAFVPSFLPVVIYFIARRFTGDLYAFLAAVFFMGQIIFLNAPSIAKTNIAMLFFGLALLMVLDGNRLNNWARFPILLVLATGMVVSHYAVTYIALFLFGATLVVVSCWGCVKKVLLPHRASILAVCLSLVVGITVWYGFITVAPWKAVTDFGRIVSTISFAETEAVNPAPYQLPECRFKDISNRDKITQTAFGVTDVGHDAPFTFHWGTFAVNWLVIALMSYGLLLTLIRWRKGRTMPLVYLLLSSLGYASVVAMVLLPCLSRVYGIERVYGQMMVVLAVYFIVGCTDVANRLHLQPYMVIAPVLLCYFYFTYFMGMI